MVLNIVKSDGLICLCSPVIGTITTDVVASPNNFYPNVTTLRSGLCCRKSVCLSSVCNVGAPYSGFEPFGKMSSPLCTLAILGPPCKILQRSSQGNPSVGGVKRKRGIKIERFRNSDPSKAISHKRYNICLLYTSDAADE